MLQIEKEGDKTYFFSTELLDMDTRGHHWYGHAQDANQVDHYFKMAFFLVFVIFILVPLLLVSPALLGLFGLIWIWKAYQWSQQS